jgi:hypothetical protein
MAALRNPLYFPRSFQPMHQESSVQNDNLSITCQFVTLQHCRVIVRLFCSQSKAIRFIQ